MKSYSFLNSRVQTSLVLQDSANNPLTGVRLALYLIQGNSSLQITTERTDVLGRSNFTVGESLSRGNYQLQVRVLDSKAVYATPIQLSSFNVNTTATTTRAWNGTSGHPQASLVRNDNGAPVTGRLVVLEQQLKDGNWWTSSTVYTDSTGNAAFPIATPSGTWHVIFKGDDFYSPSSSDAASILPSLQPASLASPIAIQSSTFIDDTFRNGHITLLIGPQASTIYDPMGQTVLGHLSWQIQSRDDSGTWQTLAWDGSFSMSRDNPSGDHRVTLYGTAGNGQVAVSMSFVARPQDALFTPLRMPLDIQALRGSYSYRVNWHLDGVSASFFQFEQRNGDERTIASGPIAVGSSINQLPAGENSMVALDKDGQIVLFGLNWDKALRYYEGTNLRNNIDGTTSATIQFGNAALSSGQHWILPACPCPDGGGGGGFLHTTSTTLYLPTSAYSTISTVLTASVKDVDNPSNTVGCCDSVNFYRDGSLIGQSMVNNTGSAALVWTPGVTGSHAITAAFSGDCCLYKPSSTAQNLTISQTPTVIEMLNPQQLAFSWDVKSNIVIPVVTLTLAPSGKGSPANIYVPPYSGTSSTPPNISGWGWAGMNQTLVTVTLNGTYSTTQTMNWTRNFYMPPCPSPPCSAATSPATGHLSFVASLSPPSNLYVASSTSLNLPYQLVVGTQSTSSNRLSQDFTPPSHLYVNVTADYPFLTVKLQNLPVALSNYTYSLDHSVGGPTSSFVSSGFTYYGVPASAYYAYVCTDPSCKTPASGVSIAMLNSNLHNCGSVTTDAFGLANIWLGFSGSCASPLPTARIYTSGTNLTLSEFFQPETGPTSLYTNFQGYAYSAYAPLQTGRYIMPAMSAATSCAFTIIYPNQSYPVVQCAGYYPPEIVLNVTKHPVLAQASFTPGTSTILDKTNATIQISDRANNKALANTSFSYVLTQTNPGSGTIASGSLTTNGTGIAILGIGLLSYGNYSLSISISATPIFNGVSASFGFTVYRAKPTVAIFSTPTLDGSSQSFCSGTSTSCSASLTATRTNDIIIVFASQIRGGLCQSFSISDSAGLTWVRRTMLVYGQYDDLEEFYAKSPNALFSDTITETVTCSTTPTNYGLQAFAVAGANLNAPFDPNSNLPWTASDSTSGPQAYAIGYVTTTSPNDFLFGGAQHETSASPTVEPGFTMITSSGGDGTEYQIVNGTASSQSVYFTYSNSSYWQMIADAIQPGSGWSQGCVANQPCSLTTDLINNATRTMINVAGLQENVYVNSARLGSYTTNSVGSVTFSWMPTTAGQYTIRTVFPGQNYYTNSSSTAMVSVAKRNVVLAANYSPQSPSINPQMTWNVYARDMINNSSIPSLPVSMYVNGVTIGSPVNTASGGNAVFQPVPSTFGSKGVYNVTFASAANSVYNPATTYNPLAVFLDTKITIQAGTIIVSQQNSISLSLKDANGVALSGRVVQIGIQGRSYQNVTTDGNGLAQFSWRPDNTGSYGIAANFGAKGPNDAGYRPAGSTLTVNVVPQSVTNAQSTPGGTQSVTLNTAQGSPQPPGFSLSISFPAWNTISVNIQFGSVSVQGTLTLSNNFGIGCAAQFLGGCVLWLPFWNALVNINVGISQASLNLPILSLSDPSISLSLQGQNQVATGNSAFLAGLAAGSVFFGSLMVPLLFAKDMASASLAALILLAGTGSLLPLVYLAALAFSNKVDRLAFSWGILMISLLEWGGGEIVGLMRGVLHSTFWPQVRVAELAALGFSVLWGVMFYSLYFGMPS